MQCMSLPVLGVTQTKMSPWGRKGADLHVSVRKAPRFWDGLLMAMRPKNRNLRRADFQAARLIAQPQKAALHLPPIAAFWSWNVLAPLGHFYRIASFTFDTFMGKKISPLFAIQCPAIIRKRSKKMRRS